MYKRQVLGEVEIIRQVKLAYESAKTRQMTDGDLNVIFQSALQLAKEIADQSMMTRLPVSVGTLTTLDALQFCAGKEEPHILLVGASGDIGSIVLRDLVDADDRVRIVGEAVRIDVAVLQIVKIGQIIRRSVLFQALFREICNGRTARHCAGLCKAGIVARNGRRFGADIGLSLIHI